MKPAINPNQHTGPFVVVRHADPAVDTNADIDWDAYYRERDPKLLRYYEGARPVEFHCRPLTMNERREVRARRSADGEPTPFSREHAFRLGVVRVLRLMRPGGEARDWEREDDSSGKGKPMTDAALELFGDATIDEVGAIIEARSFLDFDQPLVCPLLGTSQRVQAHLRLHRAALMNASSKSPHSKPEVEATATTPPATPAPSPDGGAHGDATATAFPTGAAT